MSARRWLTLGIVIVVLALGGPYVYIHFIKGSEPGKFKLSTAGGGGESVPLDGTWTVGPGSQAGYRVGEVLLGQSSTAVGRTGSVTGSMAIKGATVESGSFTVDMRTVKSEQTQRDRAFHGRIMQTSTFPTATFATTKPIDFGSVPADGSIKKVSATGNLTLHGVTRPVTIALTVGHSGATIQVVGNLNIVFAEWNVPNPSFAGLVTTDDHGELEFLLKFTRGSAPTATTASPTTAEVPTTGPSPGGPPPGGFTPPTVTPTTLAPLQIPY